MYSIWIIIIVNHLFYMDDLKLYASNEKQVKSLLNHVHTISKDIGMKFGIDKCGTVTIIKGRLKELPGIELNEHTTINAVVDTYKYLDILESHKIEHTIVKQTLRKEFESRLRGLLKTKLNSLNLTKAINTYAIPVLSYSFGIVKWTNTDLDQLNRRIRVLMTRSRKHHPKACMERITLPRNQGGRGIQDIKEFCYRQISDLRAYFFKNESRGCLHRIIVKADKNFTPLNFNQRSNIQIPEDSTTREKIRLWSTKELHGRFYRFLYDDETDIPQSLQWAIQGYLNPETEGFLIAIQDQVVKTRNYAKYILGEAVDSDLSTKKMP